MVKRYLFIDGNNLARRSFHAITNLQNSAGFPTNLLKGYLTSTKNLCSIVQPDHVFHFFDEGRDLARLKIHEGYKNNRTKAPSEFIQQMKVLKEIVCHMGHGKIGRSDTEADDLIASAAHLLQDDLIILCSADKDFNQCINDNVLQLVPFAKKKAVLPSTVTQRNWMMFNAQCIHELYGIYPNQIVDFLALMGDAVDQIKGVEGIGEKRAAQYIAEYGNIENLLKNCDQIKQKHISKRLAESAELLQRNQQLITLNQNLPIPELEQEHHENLNALQDALDELEIRI